MVGTYRIDILGRIFEKVFLRFSLFFIFFLGKLQSNFVHFSQKIDFFQVISGNYRRNLKNKNLHSAFLKICPKMLMGRVPTKIFGVSEFFYRKFVKKNFRGRGPQKSTILGLFSKIYVRNFCQLGKNVFFVLPIFSKNRGNVGLFWGVRPKIVFTKHINIARFVYKN